MSNTNKNIYNALKKCKYYEDEIMRNTYFRPWNLNIIDLDDEQICLDLEYLSNMNKLKSSNDSIKQYYSSHGFERGFPEFKNRNYEGFGRFGRLGDCNCFYKILILFIIALLITFIIKNI